MGLFSKTSKKKGGKKSREGADRTQMDEEDGATAVEASGSKLKFRKTTPKKQSARKQKTPIKAPTAAGKEAYVNAVKATCATGIQGLLEEFNEIKRLTQAIGDTPKVAFDSNPTLNRYKDVFCVDESRVVLRWPEGSPGDYIHANNVPVDEKHKYICTQGPIPTTIDDFWRMVWQEKCKSILMLCNIMEQGKKKCEQYWPEGVGAEAQYGGVHVKVVKSGPWLKCFTRTTLAVSDGGTEPLEVEHVQWVDWPDRGVPLDTSSFAPLLALLAKASPVVIHCSAGIGRTGTIVGLDMLFTRLRAGQMTTIKEVVTALRAKRHGSVQMDIQYLYMHRVLLADAVKQGLVPEEEVADFVTQYEALCKQRGFM